MDNNYMLLQNRNVRIPLLSKDGSWKFTINRKKWEIPLCMELLYAYHLIGAQDYAATSATLRANYRHITPIQIEEFIQYFEKTHPVENCSFDINKIPVYATDKYPLCVPNCFSYDVLLTEKQEKEILDVIKKINNTEDGRGNVSRWFGEYTARYSLIPNRRSDVTFPEWDLARTFCEIHGIDFEGLFSEEARKEDDRQGCLFSAAMIFGAIFIIFWAMYAFWGDLSFWW